MEKWKTTDKISVNHDGDVYTDYFEIKSTTGEWICTARNNKAELICKAPEIYALLEKIRKTILESGYTLTGHAVQDIKNEIMQIL